jgi:predicted HTH domain antitoxin
MTTKTMQITFDVSESLLHTLNQSREEFVMNTRLWTAMNLFAMAKLTLMQAADLAGLGREQFMAALHQTHIPLINYDPDELGEELARWET